MRNMCVYVHVHVHERVYINCVFGVFSVVEFFVCYFATSYFARYRYPIILFIKILT